MLYKPSQVPDTPIAPEFYTNMMMMVTIRIIMMMMVTINIIMMTVAISIIMMMVTIRNIMMTVAISIIICYNSGRDACNACIAIGILVE